ncbi:MAG TPA: DUF4410 domain-containing protein [Terracidiphilus sp.]|nr:DUF4410 domain-containing protein [Terracidiphilus sp.]
MLLCLGLSSIAQEPKQQSTIQDKYHVIEVNDFQIREGVDLKPEYFTALQDELQKQLEESHKFQAVLKPGQPPPQPDMPVLRLTGVITKFNSGSRAKRYFFSYGAGSSQIFVHTKYLDRATGETVIEGEVIGTLSGGFFGGDTKNVMNQFAKAVVTTTKLMLLKTPAPPGSTTAQPASSAEPAAPRERQTMAIAPDLLEDNQKTLNDFAAKGYRLVDYSSTSNKSAVLTLEKSDDQQSRTYMMFQTLRLGTLQKELNKAASEGYRLVPHTLGYLKGYFLIAEKPASAQEVKYEYRLHATARVGSAEKNIREDQAQGYVLIDASQMVNSLHVIVLEREISGTAKPPES